jgi:ankyrin repeat protein
MRGSYVSVLALCLVAGAQAQNPADELIKLIRADDLTALKARFAAGANVNTADSRGTTLLIHAAAIGSPDAVKLLLESGADAKAKNQLEETALLLGAGDIRKARLLTDAGADVNARSKLGRTPLMIAAACDGCAAAVKLLLEKGADPKAKDARGITALNAAADANDLETMKLLIAKGAEADHQDESGNTPLQSAATNCNYDAAKMLLAKGANVNAANRSGGEVKFGKIQLIKLTPLMLASSYCSAELVKLLLDAKADVNARDIREMTPLMFAVSSESQSPLVVKLLIKAGADVNAKSKVGESALDWARKSGYPEVLFALIAAKAEEGMPYSAPAVKPAVNRTVAQAMERGTAIVQAGATEFFTQSGCVGCHHQPAAALAAAAARNAGVHVDEGAVKGYIKMIEGQSTFFQQTLLERLDRGGLVDGPNWELMALAAEHYAPTLLTDTVVAYIANFQRRDGSWWNGGVARAPVEEGRILRTAMAIRAMSAFGTPAMKADFDRRIALARSYLSGVKAATNDDMAMQIAGLSWSGSTPEKLRSLAKALIGTQHEDGGWSQNRNLASDAYATGETLAVLNEAGLLKPADSAYQRGVKFLLAHQCEDGSWYVRSRAPKFQPYFQSGFPFEHDQWISSIATSWAVRALSPAAENQKRASR